MQAQNVNQLTGKVSDISGAPLVGATIQIEETMNGTVSDINGAFTLNDLGQEPFNLTIAYLGYTTIQRTLNPNEISGSMDFVMIADELRLGEVTVTAQKREQEIQDVPISISVMGRAKIEKLGTNNLDELSDFIPGLNIQVQSNQRPGYVIRGITSDGNDPNSQPRVSVYYDNIPINRASGAVVEPYDMQRVEVIKGPQGTLFGRGAQIGAVHFIPAKPKNVNEGGIKASYGSYNSMNLTGYVNTPISDKAAFRIAGTVDRMDGFVNNTFGGSLNGKNTIAGRASLRLLPSDRFSINLMLDYQNDDAPGVAFVTKNLANQNGESGVFIDNASLEQGEDLETSKNNTLSSLQLRYDISDQSSLTSISSYRWHDAFERYDADGSAARTLDFSEENKANQFYQELRLNSQVSQKLFTVLGASYFTEDVDREFIFRFDEQSVATFFFLRDPSQIVDENGEPRLFTALPQSIPGLGGAPLPTNHAESRFQTGVNSSFQLFFDGTYEISDAFSLSGGLRLVFDNISVAERNEFVESSDASVLGNLTRRAPNLFSPILDFPETETSSTAITGRLVAKYDLDENSNIYASYSRGRRPEAIEFRNDGETEILASETVDNYELGFKTNVGNKTLFGISTYYHSYSNFRTTAFIDIDDLTMGTPEVFQSNAGEATAFGIEMDFNSQLSEQFILFGNYNYIRARFADEDSEGNEQEYAGNMFRLTPDHSFAIGFDYNIATATDLNYFITPSFTFKSKHFFDDANPVDADNPNDSSLNSNQFQDAYGLLNLNIGVDIPKNSLSLTLFAKNLLDQNYVIDAGNTGAAILGQATYVRGRPRVIGARVEYTF